MTKPFKGIINVDIRDSVPDWAPYEAQKPPEGAPNVLMVVWDDTGMAAWDTFGGTIEMPTLNRIADMGIRYANWHTTALCSPTRSCLLTGRNCHMNGMAVIEEATRMACYRRSSSRTATIRTVSVSGIYVPKRR
jgi:arylsulfatase A-like enzyme